MWKHDFVHIEANAYDDIQITSAYMKLLSSYDVKGINVFS